MVNSNNFVRVCIPSSYLDTNGIALAQSLKVTGVFLANSDTEEWAWREEDTHSGERGFATMAQAIANYKNH